MRILYYLPVILVYGFNLILLLVFCYLPFDQNVDLSIDLGILILKDGFVRFALIILDFFLAYKLFGYLKNRISDHKRKKIFDHNDTTIKEPKTRYKITNFEQPKLLLSTGIENVDEQTFLKIESNRIPLFIGTQYGLIPEKYADLDMFIGRKIGFTGKSLLSGAETEIKEYLVNEKTIDILTKNRGKRIITKF